MSWTRRISRAALPAVALAAVLAAGPPACGAERVWDFGKERTGELPKGFRSLVSGEGQPGDWRILEVPLGGAATEDTQGATFQAREAVLGQVAQDPTDEHFPLLLWEGERYADFTFSAQVRTLEGQKEQMAGLAFRAQDERNYYVLRVSSLGGTVRFYKFVDGVRSPPLGPEVAVERGVWHTLTVECSGNQIRCSFNGRELFPPLTDHSFSEGKIGFWTKSDSVSHFRAPRLIYTPREPRARALVRRAMADYGRLVAVKLYAARPGSEEVRLVASSDPGEAEGTAGKNETDVARRGTLYYSKGKGTVSVLLPLRDRNGDPVAAVRVVMDSFPGQTQDNALVRARPVVEDMADQIRTQADLFD